MNALIPFQDSAEFSDLSDDVRRYLHSVLRAIGRLLIISRGRCSAFAHEARELGLSEKTLQNKFYAYLNGCTRMVGGVERTFAPGDWRMLIDYSKAQPAARILPKEFIEFWRMLCEKNQRKTKPAWRFLIRGYHKRRWIVDGKVYAECPGYPVFPSPNGKGIPHGWSYTNLLNYQPTRFELAAMREGLGVAVARHVPKILHTRVGLWVGSHYSFDDVKRDVKALLISRNQIVEVQELGAMDFFSADRFAVHRRPIYKEGDRADHVKEREMRFLVAGVLRHVGYSPRGTEFIVERGTAAIREPLEEFLHEHSDEKITVRRSGISGREQALKGYWGAGGGNPRHKALHESYHNLLHNESAHLPAPTGHDRNPPEWLFGLEAVTQEVCKRIARMLASDDIAVRERAGLLFAPMCEYWQLIELLKEIDQFIAWRHDHRIEGWEKCGHTTVEYRRDAEKDDWLSTNDFLALPDGDQSLIQAAALANPRYRRPRKLAPREVFRRGGAELVQFPDHVIALMFADDRLGEDLRETKSLTPDGEFDISNQFAGPERMRFAGFVRTHTGDTRALVEREEYGVVLNPWDADQLWVYNKNGGFLGVAPRVERLPMLTAQRSAKISEQIGASVGECGAEPNYSRPAPSPELLRALGQREQTISMLCRPLRDRHANAVRELEQLEIHNDRVEAGASVTKEEIRAERSTRARIHSVQRQLTEEKRAAMLTPDFTDDEPQLRGED